MGPADGGKVSGKRVKKRQRRRVPDRRRGRGLEDDDVMASELY